jgi:isoquinoline 1-oxidoreductase alpha subunit
MPYSLTVNGRTTVHIDGQPMHSCITAASAAAGKRITTIEGLSPDGNDPVQRTWMSVDVASAAPGLSSSGND